jgi:actin related protein 2/3 complex subunit 1A/1B
VSFSPDGDRLAWVSHDSSISVADAKKGMNVNVLRTRFLPFLSCVWSSPNLIVAAVSHMQVIYTVKAVYNSQIGAAKSFR